ncbi:MAG: CHASE2 domain-containing protein [Deltaproteobacteria bacterium]|nr:CHASE2 domain-containing protein [Deltaproteobacteria bacterium]MBI3294755.1 CHASE2 domain-containing protein [Deltaproteobacteria bacterium]
MNRSPEKSESRRSQFFSHISVSILGALFVFAVLQFEMDGLKGIVVDALFRLPAFDRPNPDIVIVAYDDSASEHYGFGARLPVVEMEGIFKTIKSQTPLAIGVIGAYNERTYSSSELNTLDQVFSSIPETIIGFNDDESLGRKRPTELSTRAPYLPGFVSRDTFSYGSDSVSRRVMLTIEGQPTLYWSLTQMYCLKKGLHCSVKNLRSETVGDSSQVYIQWRNFRYPSISSQLVVRGDVPADFFRNKIVLIGTALSARKGADHILTPYSRTSYETPMLQGAAQSLATLIDGQPIARSSHALDWFLAIVIGLVTVNFVLAVSPGKGILFVLGECLTLFVIGWAALRMFGTWLDLAHPLVVACVGYYLVIPYRLVDEYRKRWHYQEKSELMAQLEQLKSNFLSLVSHDLKTPIARIQGNAELVLGLGEQLPEAQRKSLTAIVKTTEDLSEYVESILDLTRIESARVPLHKTTRDINSTILEVVEEKQPLAVEKNIRLKTKLDPIFSIRYDVKLMKRVIGNLVENAIQYSPRGSSITLISHEDGDWVKISVADQGFGIAHSDQEKVFYKFYRGGSENTQRVKGTGLGLYLVKYFVELHKGFINLESELGKGSTFTVTLPVA